MNKLRYLILLFWVVIILHGCKTSRTVTDFLPILPINENQLVDRIRHSQPELESISFHRASVKIESDNQKQSFRSNFFLQKDSFFRVSVLAPFGIELLRISFEPGQIIIIDRLNKSVIYAGYEEVNKRVGFNMNFNILQNLFLNRAFSYFESDGIRLVDYFGGIDDRHYKLASIRDRRYKRLVNKNNVGNIVFHRLWVDPENFYLRKTSFLLNNNDLNVDVVFNDFNKENSGFYFPEGFTIEGNTSENKFLMDVSYGSIRFNDANNISFNIPDKYEKVYR